MTTNLIHRIISDLMPLVKSFESDPESLFSEPGIYKILDTVSDSIMEADEMELNEDISKLARDIFAKKLGALDGTAFFDESTMIEIFKQSCTAAKYFFANHWDEIT